ncbi:hypothetical protein M378DRAFT_855693 [Amanita muscaria Koide BX008]|uniref:Uncharacterized protein n=1 Tax=Amanita muscaria (strain Koide BX008) TaxID=946122 RepID=A0A0C2WIT7_AMAMK|nr:hypothetical protein M378DRAFT_855693 [Amanita muscaria Koide BX008]
MRVSCPLIETIFTGRRWWRLPTLLIVPKPHMHTVQSLIHLYPWRYAKILPSEQVSTESASKRSKAFVIFPAQGYIQN